MGRKIGNIGVLNLQNATEESVADIESIENVGLLIHSEENARLIARMSIGNVGKSIEVPKGCQLITGLFEITEELLESLAELEEPVRYMVTGSVLIHRSVTPERLSKAKLAVRAVGIVHVPKALYGAVGSIVQGDKLRLYEEAPPRMEIGTRVLSNAYLKSLDGPISLFVAGTLILAEDLDLALADGLLKELSVTGMARMRESQAAFFYRKAGSLVGCQVEVIPTGFREIDRLLKLNARSIRRFRAAGLYTRHPVLLDSDVTREALSAAFSRIETSSFLLCREELEDLAYELVPSLEAEVLTYPQDYLYVEDREVLSGAELAALPSPVQLVVEGSLEFAEDVREETLAAKLSGIDIFGTVTVPDSRLKGLLQPYIRTQQGSLRTAGEGSPDRFLDNIGMLSL